MKIKDYFEDYLEYMRLNDFSITTIRKRKDSLYRPVLNSLVGDIELNKLKIIDIAKIRHEGKKHGKYGPQDAIIAFRMLLKFIKDSGITLPLDYRDIEVPKVSKKEVDYLLIEELEFLRKNIDITKIGGLRTRVLIEVLLSTGMRISEAISLNIRDIRWEAKEAKVTNAKPPHDEETVYFTDKSLWWIQKYLDARDDGLPYLFVSGRGRLLAVTSRAAFRKYTKHIETVINKHIYHHIMRKTYATYLLQSGLDPNSAKILTRHRTVNTLLRYYAGAYKERAKEQHQRIMEGI